MELQELIKTQLSTAPATDEEIKRVKELVTGLFPAEYEKFLRTCDGGVMRNERAIFYSCGDGLPEGDRIVTANCGRENHPLLFIGRFAEDEFGYKMNGLSAETHELYVYDHEEDEIHVIANSLADFLEKYSAPVPRQQKKMVFVLVPMRFAIKVGESFFCEETRLLLV